MSYRALYRQWRPKRFAEVVGQDHITRALQNAVRQGRVGHAYLLSGPRGTGKTSLARILAMAVNCQNAQDGEPCLECAACQRTLAGQNLDLQEIDAASNRKVEEARELLERVGYAPAGSRYKVYIIDEAHMLTTEAFNTLLKTLEEPPAHALFILATTEPRKILPTILSRCQRFDLHRLQTQEIEGQLAKICRAMDQPYEEEALSFLARRAEGGLRDALSLLDQALAFAQGPLTAQDVALVLGRVTDSVLREMAEAMERGDAAALLAQVAEIYDQGWDLHGLVADLTSYWRERLLEAVASAQGQSQVGSADAVAAISARLTALAETDWAMRQGTLPRIQLELGLLRALRGAGDGAVSAKPATAAAATVSPTGTAVASKVASTSTSPMAPLQGAETGAKPATAAAKGVARARSRSRPASTGADKPAAPRAPAASDELAEVWRRVVAAVQQARVTTAALLHPAQPVAVEDRELVIAFGKESTFHKTKMEQVENRRLLDEAVAAVLGPGAKVRIIEADHLSELAQAAAQAPVIDTVEPDAHGHASDASEEHPLLRQLHEVFGEGLIPVRENQDEGVQP